MVNKKTPLQYTPLGFITLTLRKNNINMYAANESQIMSANEQRENLSKLMTGKKQNYNK